MSLQHVCDACGKVVAPDQRLIEVSALSIERHAAGVAGAQQVAAVMLHYHEGCTPFPSPAPPPPPGPPAPFAIE